MNKKLRSKLIAGLVSTTLGAGALFGLKIHRFDNEILWDGLIEKNRIVYYDGQNPGYFLNKPDRMDIFSKDGTLTERIIDFNRSGRIGDHDEDSYHLFFEEGERIYTRKFLTAENGAEYELGSDSISNSVIDASEKKLLREVTQRYNGLKIKIFTGLTDKYQL
jgi:hypothetical protein